MWVGVNFYGSMGLGVNYLWVSVNFLWVVVGGCELFMGWRELLWVDMNFLWVHVGRCELFMGGCGLV